jgi:hypothetical protein
VASCNVVKDLKTAIIEAKQDNKFNHETQENKKNSKAKSTESVQNKQTNEVVTGEATSSGSAVLQGKEQLEPEENLEDNELENNEEKSEKEKKEEEEENRRKEEENNNPENEKQKELAPPEELEQQDNEVSKKTLSGIANEESEKKLSRETNKHEDDQLKNKTNKDQQTSEEQTSEQEESEHTQTEEQLTEEEQKKKEEEEEDDDENKDDKNDPTDEINNDPNITNPKNSIFSISNANVNEATGEVFITIIRQDDNGQAQTKGAARVSISSGDDTAIAGEDYQSFDFNINFPDGVASKRIKLTDINNDIKIENTENFNIELHSPDSELGQASIGNGGAAVNIFDNDTHLAITGQATADENSGSVIFTVTRTGITNVKTTVDFATEDGTATAGSDYTARSDQLTFAAGETEKLITIALTDDSIALEDDETFKVRLSNPTGASQTTIISDVANISTQENDTHIFLKNLDSRQGRVFNGANNGDQTGFSVAGVGDINGDGLDDILIGAPATDFNNHTNNGATFLINGRNSDSNTSSPHPFDLGNSDHVNASNEVLRFSSDTDDFALGQKVSSAGDFNGDGLDDFLISSAKGRAYLIFGQSSYSNTNIELSPSAMDASKGFAVFDSITGSNTTFRVSSAGDFNGDGLDDIIIGNINYNSGAGQSTIIFGTTDTGNIGSIDLQSISSSEGFKLTGGSSNLSGVGISSAGDINNDGFDDILIGAPQINSSTGTGSVDAGKTHIIYGNNSDSQSDIDLTNINSGEGTSIQGETPDDLMGYSVAGLGDINGDGIDDFIIGAPLDSTINSKAGSAYVIFGNESFHSQSTLNVSEITNGFVIRGSQTNGYLGIVSAAGDINGDGFNDILLAERGHDNNGNEDAGIAHVIFGQETITSSSTFDLNSLNGNNGFSIYGTQSYDKLGAGLSGAGDVNGDGFDDILIGAPQDSSNNDSGKAFLLFGDNFTRTTTITEPGSDGVLRGSSSDDRIIGSTGNDTIVTAGGKDTVRAGEGNDNISIINTQFRSIEGGKGFDTLKFGSSDISIDLTGIARDKVKGIEAIDLGNTDNILTLKVGDILDLPDKAIDIGGLTKKTLFITGTSSDQVIVSNGLWVQQSAQFSKDGIQYDNYISGQARLLIQDTISNITIDNSILGFDGGSTGSILTAVSVTEGDFNHILTVTQTKSTVATATVDYSIVAGTATDGSDFTTPTGISNGSLTFAAGESKKLITITIKDDSAFEEDETFNVVLSNSQGATINPIAGNGTVNFTIKDNEKGISIADTTQTEGNGTAIFTVTRSGNTSSSATVEFQTADGTATAGSTGSGDYESKTGTITFAANETTQAITVTINDDSTAEDDENFSISLTNANGGSLTDSSATGTITDNDTGLSIGDQSKSEDGNSFLFTVTRTGNTSAQSTVEFSTSDNTATSGTTGGDYVSNSGTLTFAAGVKTQTISITINNDSTVESDETLDISLSNATGATITDGVATGTITNDDSSLSISDVTVSEGAGNAVFTITRTGNTSLAETVEGTSINGTAKAPGDFTSTSGTLTFAAGESSKTLTVAINDDTQFLEGNESFSISLAQASSSTLSDSLGIGTITENDITLELSSLNGSNGFVINGSAKDENLGLSVSSAGDFNNDGFDDILTGGAFVDSNFDAVSNPQNPQGDGYIIFGGTSIDSSGTFDTSSLNGSNGFSMTGKSASDLLGFSVSELDDTNGDGFADFAISALGANTQSGETYIVYGNNDSTRPPAFDLSTLNGNNGFSISGKSSGDFLFHTNSAGDFNGDGLTDIIVGAQSADGNNSNNGEIYVIFGKTSDGNSNFDLSSLNGSNGFSISGVESNDKIFNHGVSGDLNGDGLDDLIISHYKNSIDDNANVGSTYVIFGTEENVGASLDLNQKPTPNILEIEGTNANDQLGFQMAVVGDINGDGYEDLAITAKYSDVNGSNSGATYIIFGTSDLQELDTLEVSDLDGSDGFVIGGIGTNNFLTSVNKAGDVNGDGYDDIIMGAPIAAPNGAASGESYVVFGDPTLGTSGTFLLNNLNGSNGFSIAGEHTLDRSGRTVDTVGDINGDGFSDLIIGAYKADDGSNTDAGKSYVVLGDNFNNEVTIGSSQTGTSGADIFVGSDSDDTLTGAGGADVLIGGKGNDTLSISSNNFVRVHGGNGIDKLQLTGDDFILDHTQLAGTKIQQIEAYETVNTSTTFNHTHIIDHLSVLNASSTNNLNFIGGANVTINVVDGSWQDLGGGNFGDGRSKFNLSSDTINVNFTNEIYINDVIVSENNSAIFTVSRRGLIDDLLTVDYITNAETASTSDFTTPPGTLTFSSGVSTLFITVSINDDNIKEGSETFNITLSNINSSTSTTFSDSVGQATITDNENTFDLSSLNGSNGFTISGISANDNTGFVSAAGDVNKDGFEDLLIGAPGRGNGGEAYVIQGNNSIPANLDLSTLDGNNGNIFRNDATYSYAGAKLANLGDINGDGFADFALSSPAVSGYTGETYIIFGSSSITPSTIFDLSSLDGNNGFALNDANTEDSSKLSVSGAGDINGDGYQDILIGAPFATPDGFKSGEAYVVYGGTQISASSTFELSSLNGSNGFTVFGDSQREELGYSVSSAGDFNGDGFDDLLIGAPSLSALNGNPGQAFLVFGSESIASNGFIPTFSLRNSVGVEIVNEGSSNAKFGQSVTSLGDINDDGFDDILIGASNTTGSTSNSGTAYVVLGTSATQADGQFSTSDLNGNNGFVINGISSSDEAGFQVASGGDINGDGIDDFLISATGADVNNNDSGSIYVIYGSDRLADNASFDLNSLNSSEGFVVSGLNTNDRIGESIDIAGDLNGDGFDDIVIGSSAANSNAGESYVIYGNDFNPDSVVTKGTSGNDNLNGDKGTNLINGGAGNDLLFGKGGDDILLGGKGNDNITVDDNKFIKIDGGTGKDTLKINATNLTLDLTDGEINIDNIEVIDLTGKGDNTLNLAKENILKLSETSNTLEVTGNSGDSLSITDGTWFTGTAGATDTTYTSGAATLIVANDISTTFTNTIKINDVSSQENTGEAVFSVTRTGLINSSETVQVATTAGTASDSSDFTALNSTLTFASNEVTKSVTVTLSDDSTKEGKETFTLQLSNASSSTIADASGTGTILDNETTTLLNALTGSNGFSVQSARNGDGLGSGVRNLGDINGDGFDDFLIGATDDGTTDRAYVIFGNSTITSSSNLNITDLNGSNGFIISGQGGFSDNLGGNSGHGDINGDGLNDFVIGASGENSNQGAAYVIFGSTSFGSILDLSSLSSSSGFKVNGLGSSDQFGETATIIGDINGDGLDDLLFGASKRDLAIKSDVGATAVIFGAETITSTASFDISSLNGSNGFTIAGLNADDQFGRYASQIGDINGDGIDDFAVAALGVDGTIKSDIGSVYVIFGNSNIGASGAGDLSALDGTTGFVIKGSTTEQSIGVSISGLGDVNGDGFDDFIFGNRNANISESYVIFGNSSFSASASIDTLDGNSGFKITTIASDYSDYSLNGAGDVNGDGLNDIIVGIPGNEDFTGGAHIVFGETSLGSSGTFDLSSINGSNGVSFLGINPGDITGENISSAGDIDGDGLDDFLLGAAELTQNRDSGQGFVLFGKDFIDSTAQLGDETANTLSGAADGDIIIGGRGNDTIIGTGGNDVLLGGQGDDILSVDDSTFQKINGGTGTDTLTLSSNFNLDLTNISDNKIQNIEAINLNNQGGKLTLNTNDLLNLSTSSNTLTVSGSSGDTLTVSDGQWIDLGKSNGFNTFTNEQATLIVDTDISSNITTTGLVLDSLDGTNGIKLNGINADDLSSSISNLGDVNGDGLEDFIIGAGNADPNGLSKAGQAYVIFGNTNFSSPIELSSLDGNNGFTINGITTGDSFGSKVGSAGDINGDGFADIIIGANDASPNALDDAGQSFVIFGSSSFSSTLEASALNGSNGFILNGAAADDDLGEFVTSGDINGDGLSDLIMGAKNITVNGNDDAGGVVVVYGKTSSFTSSIDVSSLTVNDGFVIHGINVNDYTGDQVSSGDINGDGIDDFIISAYTDTNGVNAGSVYVLFGQTANQTSTVDLSALNGSNGFVINGINANDLTGSTVSFSNDINGDGFGDILISADDASPNGKSDAGQSYVVFGASSFSTTLELSSLDGNNGITLNGATAKDDAAISTAGDINGDGFDDLIVGAEDHTNFGNYGAGSSFLLFGSSSLASTIELSEINASNGFIFLGQNFEDYSGTNVSQAGDVNGDGFDDLLISAPNADPNGISNAGTTYLLYGGNQFTGSATQSGDSSDNTLTGTTAQDIIAGGLGDDIIIGSGGTDVLRGGAGDDTLAISDTSFQIINGGTGTDTLRLDGTDKTLNLTSLADNKIQNIENIDLSQSGNHTVALKLSDVLNISDSTNTLKIIGSTSGDTVTANSETWTQGTSSGGFTPYTLGNATLLIDDNIDRTGITI